MNRIIISVAIIIGILISASSATETISSIDLTTQSAVQQLVQNQRIK